MSQSSSSFSGEHKHCPLCGRSIPVSQQFCSIECEHSMTNRVKSQRRNNWIFLGILVVLMLFMIFGLRGGS